MNDTTQGGTTRLPQAALDKIAEEVANLPPLTDCQRADLSTIIYGGRSLNAAA
jgi:hypothetical protein